MVNVANQKRAVALLSGGLDSSMALRLAMNEGFSISLAINFDYGQRASSAEKRQAQKIASHFDFPLKVIELPWFKDFGAAGMLLSRKGELPHPNLDQLSEREFSTRSAKAVWVPNRNGVFLEIAAGFAEDNKAQAVVVGFNAEEAETFPDNSVDYLRALAKAFTFSTSTFIEIISPTASMTKSRIVAAALEMDFPLHLLWSCYEDGANSNEKMCGRCESCMRLRRALSSKGQRTEFFF